jgi:hypothetical protein
MTDAGDSALPLGGDPAREGPLAGATPDLDTVLALYPPTEGEPAHDPALIAAAADRLQTTPPVNTGHPLLDLSVKVALAHIDATFTGDHPHYGVKAYAAEEHDGFPPTIIAAVDALSAWGLNARAVALFRYWLRHFVHDDGRIAYYGPSVSEYGQLLHVAVLLLERTGPDGWLEEGMPRLNALAGHLRRLRGAAGEGALIAGIPEADTKERIATYFHNNAWAAKGLRRWANAAADLGAPGEWTELLATTADGLARDTLAAIHRTWPDDPADWWLSPQVEPAPRPQSLTDGELASYTNYRYWPELLSSDLLPPALANRVVEARLAGGGQFCGMTRFYDHLDDWPLAGYLSALWSLGRRDDFLLSLYGHVAYHQAEGHLTAYEQVALPPGREVAPYCLPCQLVAARAARVLVG